MTAVCAALERLAPDAIRALELRVNELEASWLWLTQRGPLQLTANC